MSEPRPLDLGTTVAGVRLPFAAMNASGAAASGDELRALAASGAGAIVLKTATVHPFLHPQFRSLHNPGYDTLLPLVRELAARGGLPVVPSVAGATADELGVLARAFAEAGAGWIEANLADPWVEGTLAPFDDLDVLRQTLRRLVGASTVPVAVKLPDRVPIPYRRLGEELAAAGVPIVVVRNDFAGLEKFLLESGHRFDVIAVGGIRSGYDVRRALAKGAAAVQVGSALQGEGPKIFARLEREIRLARR